MQSYFDGVERRAQDLGYLGGWFVFEIEEHNDLSIARGEGGDGGANLKGYLVGKGVLIRWG